MLTRRSKILLFAGSYILCTLLYWRGLGGEPLWDDYTFWFHNFDMTSDYPWWKVWSEFTWPLSVTLQRFLLSWFGQDYFYYHLTNLGLHFFNSYLVYLIARSFQLRLSFACFLLFLLHPANVISVNWMVQIKTLLCFGSAALSLICFLKGRGKPWMLVASIFLYLAAVLSKSASLPLSGVFFLIALKNFRKKQFLWLIPFFAISLYGGLSLFESKVTQKGVGRAHEEVSTLTPTKNAPDLTLKLPLGFVSQTLTYYFWQTVLPLENPPVRGPKLEAWDWVDGAHLVFLGLMGIVWWRDRALGFLLAGHVLLIPFIGLIPAPYMSVTWVSDQHLYLVLPAFLAFWLRFLEKAPPRVAHLCLTLVLIFFSVKTSEAVKHYVTQIDFFGASLEYNPLNIPVAYNLAHLHLTSERPEEALEVLGEIMALAELRPEMKSSRYYAVVVMLYLKLKNSPGKSHAN